MDRTLITGSIGAQEEPGRIYGVCLWRQRCPEQPRVEAGGAQGCTRGPRRSQGGFRDGHLNLKVCILRQRYPEQPRVDAGGVLRDG